MGRLAPEILTPVDQSSYILCFHVFQLDLTTTNYEICPFQRSGPASIDSLEGFTLKFGSRQALHALTARGNSAKPVWRQTTLSGTFSQSTPPHSSFELAHLLKTLRNT
jgi:hypothetical protein